MAIGDGALGFFDPSHCDDPSVAGRIWRSYSAVDVSPTYGLGLISTRMARSDNYGASWVDVGLVNQAFDIEGGFMSNFEVSSLAYVEGDAEPWKLVYYHAFQNMAIGSDPWVRYDPTLSWIAIRSATSPDGSWGVETKLMSGTNNNHDVGGAPAFESDALIVSEPGILACPGGFWLAYQANVSGNAYDMEVRLCKITSAATVKADKPRLLTPQEIFWIPSVYGGTYPILKTAVALTAPALFEKGGETYMIATPVNAAYTYLGIAVFKIHDLESARVARTTGWPTLLAFIPAGDGEFMGAGAYSANSTSTGLVKSVLSVSQSPIFQIQNTSVQVP